MFHVKHILFLLALGFAPTLLAAIPEKVTFPSAEDTPSRSPTLLTGYLYRPEQRTEKPTTSQPAIILAHGCSGMIDEKGRIKRGVSHWADRFIAKGFVVLAVDSFNPRGHREICTLKERPIRESRERPRDAVGALQYLAKLGSIDPKRIFLMGFSNGASGTLYAVEEGSKPQAIAMQAGVSFRAALAFYPGCTNLNEAKMTPAIPLAIFIGAADDWTPAAPCRELIERNKKDGKPVAYFDYPDAYHAFDVLGAKVRIREDVRMANRPHLAKGVHVGGNEAARIQAEKDVDQWLAPFLTPTSAPKP
jgi:dienelactone hydrolase